MSGRDASEPKVNMLDHGNKQTNIAIGCKINQNTTSIMQIQNKCVSAARDLLVFAASQSGSVHSKCCST